MGDDDDDEGGLHRWAVVAIALAALVTIVSAAASFYAASVVLRSGSAPVTTPLWAKLLALLPPRNVAFVARAVSLAMWTLLFGWIVIRAPRRRRSLTALFAGFFLGVWMLTVHVASGGPDAVAAALAGLALLEVARSASPRASAADPVVPVGLVAGALFAIAACLRPSVVGLLPGTLVGAMVATSARGGRLGAGLRGVLPAFAGFVLVSVVLVVTVTLSGGRPWLADVARSAARVPSLAAWRANLFPAASLVLFPILTAIVVGLRPPRDPGATVALFALFTSFVWALACLSRPGSAPTYLLEPVLATVVLIARADFPSLAPGPRLLLSFLAFAQVAWSCVIAVKRGVLGSLHL